ncbi:hypothetical protein Dimus_024302 [Dionaea muscipula]
MNDNGLSNVMELIKRQKWEKLFKRRELVHVDAVKEFYARFTLSHYKKKEDHELPYGDWLTMVFEDFCVPLVDKKGEEPKRYDYFEETFLTMYQLKKENGVWWIGIGENRRRDDDDVAPAEEVNEEEEAQNSDFDWEVVVDEDALQGESGSDDQFFYAQVEVEEPTTKAPAVPEVPAPNPVQQKEQTPARVDPSGPSGHIPDSVMSQLQANFKRAQANRIQADLEKAQAENARLLALLQQAQSQPKP